MALPSHIVIKDGALPPVPGVYLMKDADGKLLYVGKATSLKTRAPAHFLRPHDARIEAMTRKVAHIDWIETPTAVEALMLEAKLIKKHQPPYNVMERDDKSDVHLVFTREPFPKPVLIREYEFAHMPKKGFWKTFGPFTSAASVKAALDALRRAFPWTTCKPGQKRPCFYRHLGLCPGVCTGEISSREYTQIMADLAQFFEGKRAGVLRRLKKEMEEAANAERYEEAAEIRNRLQALEHMRDISVIKRDEKFSAFIDVFGRIEGYDISNISGQDSVGSMVVFEDGEPKKSAYRIFKIKGVAGANDVASMAEVMRRRFARVLTGEKGWAKPDLLLIDGGAAQIAAVKAVLESYGLTIPMIGIAKGPDRKKDELIYDRGDHEVARLAQAFKPLLQRVRDEAHRFAGVWHRRKRSERFLAE